MSKATMSFAAMILLSLPCAAVADNYPVPPTPVVPGVVPSRSTPRQVFAFLDTNHDGYLTLGEYLSAPWITNKAQAQRFFYWMDTNKDRYVSLPEFLAAYQTYIGSSGVTVRTAYPWAWCFWRPWRYGWYWQTGWHRAPGAWPAYAVQPRVHVVVPSTVARNRVVRGPVARGAVAHGVTVKHPHVAVRTARVTRHKPAKVAHKATVSRHAKAKGRGRTGHPHTARASHGHAAHSHASHTRGGKHGK
jgi:hypothetical protein